MSIDTESGPARGTPFVNTSGGKEVSVTDEAEAAKVVEEVLDHRRMKLGKLVGLAGMPRHGKTEFAKQVRDNRKFGQDDIRDYGAGGKTYGGKVNIYFLPGNPRRDVMIDLAGEDFQEFGRYASGIPEVMQRVLWPVLPRLDGLVLFIALPYLWSAWNQVDESGRIREPGELDLRATERETLETINSAILLLKYALVAKQLDRARKKHRNLELVKPADHRGLWAPTRHTIDEAFKAVDPLEIPVFIAFSKSDLCMTASHPQGLRTPPLPANGSTRYQANIRPAEADPLVLGMQAFPRLFEFLSEHVRYFKFDFVQTIRDTSKQPDPAILTAHRGVPELRGVESALEFVANHPWGIGSPGTAKAIEWAKRADPERWKREGMRKALGETWAATMPAFFYMPAPPLAPSPSPEPSPEPEAESEPPPEPSPTSRIHYLPPASATEAVNGAEVEAALPWEIPIPSRVSPERDEKSSSDADARPRPAPAASDQIPDDEFEQI